MLTRIARKNFISAAFSALSVPSIMRKEQSVDSTDHAKKVSLEMKLLTIRNLVDSSNSAPFRKLVDKHDHKVFLEKFQILEEIERKIFCRMLVVGYVPDEYHHLDDLVSLQELLALDSSSSAPIHLACEKLRKFVCNYQTSYERWMEILSSLQDELLMQLIGDYDEYMGIKEPAVNKLLTSLSPMACSGEEERLVKTSPECIAPCT